MYKGQPATFVVQYFASPAATAAAAATYAPPASFSDSLARSLGKLASEPRATTAWILGGIIALLALALALSFFLHMQIQAHDLLVPGMAVAVVVLALLVINSSAFPGVIHDSQAASVANAILFP